MGLLLAIDVYKGGVPLQHYEFSSDMQRIVRLGKLHSAQVKLDDPAVSRIHAIIELASGQAMLVDMGADGGTLVNGKRVSKVRLNHGDQIQIGETVLVVAFGASVSHDTYVAATMPAASGSPTSVAPASASSGAGGLSAPGVLGGAGTGGRYASGGGAPATASPPGSGLYAAASGYTGVAAGMAAGGPGAGSRTPPSAQRLLARLSELSPEATAELERYAEYLRWRQGGGGLPAAAAEPAGLSADDREPERARTTGRHDTLSLVAEMKRDRRTRQLIVVGVMGVIVLVLLLLVLRDPPTNGAATPSQANAPAQGRPGTTQSASAPETSAPPTAAATSPPPAANATAGDPSVFVYHLPKDQSLAQLAEELWQRPEHASMLAKVNPTIVSTETTVAKDTAIRIPRTTSYQVQSGDTLAVIAQKMLGRSDLYRLIQDANAEELPDPSQIEVGMVLKVPLLHGELERRLAASPPPLPAVP